MARKCYNVCLHYGRCDDTLKVKVRGMPVLYMYGTVPYGTQSTYCTGVGRSVILPYRYRTVRYLIELGESERTTEMKQ
jgi:hypothetical protein